MPANAEKNSIIKKISGFIKKEAVLSAAAILAVISMFFVQPDKAYAGYIDYRVISLLFCLMLVVAGLQSVGLFRALGSMLLRRAGGTRQLIFILVFLCFFCSMFITNDVSLITFVPFAVMLLTASGMTELLIPVIALQTIAANLGSMLTPIGNPQNLYLYSGFHIPIQEFLLLMLPLTIISALLLVAAIMLLKNKPIDTDTSVPDSHLDGHAHLIAYLILFLVCIACVIHIIEYPIMLIITAVVIFLCDRKLFTKVDYFLLLTFVCFFIFYRKYGKNTRCFLSDESSYHRARSLRRNRSLTGHKQCSRSNTLIRLHRQLFRSAVRCQYRRSRNPYRLARKYNIIPRLLHRTERTQGKVYSCLYNIQPYIPRYIVRRSLPVAVGADKNWDRGLTQ